MRIVILNTDYPAFLSQFYGLSPQLAGESYAAQMMARNSSLFGEADNYSSGMRSHGADAFEIHANNVHMQTAWARENGLALSTPSAFDMWAERIRRRLYGKRLDAQMLKVLAAQLEHYRPDVVLNQDMYLIPAVFLKRHAPLKSLIVGQIASPLPAHGNFSAYDLVLSSLPNLVEKFRSMGIPSELCRLAFDPRVLSQVPPQADRRGTIFIGSLSGDHRRRLDLLEHLSRNLDEFEIWGAGIEQLPHDSPIRARHKGEAWGKEMYRLLARAAIAINSHIDIAEGHANNLRLYEATGMGALLLTDAQMDLFDIFTLGKEVATYVSPNECLEQVRSLMNDAPRRLEMAALGHDRTLHEHNFPRRMGELLRLFGQYSRLRA